MFQYKNASIFSNNMMDYTIVYIENNLPCSMGFDSMKLMKEFIVGRNLRPFTYYCYLFSRTAIYMDEKFNNLDINDVLQILRSIPSKITLEGDNIKYEGEIIGTLTLSKLFGHRLEIKNIADPDAGMYKYTGHIIPCLLYILMEEYRSSVKSARTKL